MELAAVEASLVSEDLDEHGLVGRNTVEINTRAMLETQRSWCELDTQLRADAGEDQGPCESLPARIARVSTAPLSAGIRRVAVGPLVAIETTNGCEPVELVLKSRAAPFRLVGHHVQRCRAQAAVLDSSDSRHELIFVHLRGLRSIRAQCDRTSPKVRPTAVGLWHLAGRSQVGTGMIPPLGPRHTRAVPLPTLIVTGVPPSVRQFDS